MRFDEVYNLHFRCNRRRLVDYPNLWAYARELYQWPGVAATVAMEQIKRHYYTTHDELNPKRIIPVGPGYDWSRHGATGAAMRCERVRYTRPVVATGAEVEPTTGKRRAAKAARLGNLRSSKSLEDRTARSPA